MYDEGHTVVGIEAATIACEDFFLESNISYTTQELEDVKGTLYKVTLLMIVAFPILKRFLFGCFFSFVNTIRYFLTKIE